MNALLTKINQKSGHLLKIFKDKTLLPGVYQVGLFSLVIGLTIILFLPGLSGNFIFDDYPNLRQLGALGGIDSWDHFFSYISGGFSGPTGRPIALASFLLDARDWPANPWSFLRTNLIVHLLIGALVFLTTRTLLQLIDQDSTAAGWMALLSSALWLINPFFVSTVLYPVQRMTQLSALFVMLGLFGYLQGRLILTIRPRLGYVLITLSVGLGTLLAVFSKENGALLPLLILIIECSLAFHWSKPVPDWRWRLIFLGLPSLALLGYLAFRVLGAEQSFTIRDFNLTERLLTQAGILWDYLWHLFVPHIQTQGLYQDGHVISTSCWQPWTTCPAILGILGLIALACFSRRRWPLLSLALMFFFTAHLLESTVLPLELYFEHRNYLPAVFLFLPVAYGLWWLRDRLKPALLLFIALAMFGSYAFATWQRTTLWGNQDQLFITWAATNPNSARAQVTAAQTWLRLDHPELALTTLEQALQRQPDSGYLATVSLGFQADLNRLDVAEFKKAATRLLEQNFNGQMLPALEALVDAINAHGSQPEQAAILASLLEDLSTHINPQLGFARRFLPFLSGKLASGQGDGEQAFLYFEAAHQGYGSVEAALRMTSILATDGHYTEAIGMLRLAETTLENAAESSLKRPRTTYRKEIQRLRAILEDDLENNLAPS